MLENFSFKFSFDVHNKSFLFFLKESFVLYKLKIRKKNQIIPLKNTNCNFFFVKISKKLRNFKYQKPSDAFEALLLLFSISG